MRTCGSASRAVALVLVAAGATSPAWSPRPALAADADAGREARRGLIARGEALFLREWSPGVASERGGDGLGPVYNDTSCVACHNLGGAGGAGPANKNVDLLTAVVTPLESEKGGEILKMTRDMRNTLAKIRGQSPPRPRAKGESPDRRPLVQLHAGFADSSSVVLHRFGTAPDYEKWRRPVLDPDMAGLQALGDDSDFALLFSTRRTGVTMPSEHGHFTLNHTQRNPPPLFGSGLIDAIPDAVLEAAARGEHAPAAAVRGRVHRLADGRIGRFGWKGQAATLDDFVLTACAVELGLEVPGHPQAADPRTAARGPAAPDLSRADCDALTAYVGTLAAPAGHRPAAAAEAGRIDAGRTLFRTIGCAGCHVPSLGNVEGIYSDLLLHDMGDALGDQGAYGFLSPDSAESEEGLMPRGPDAFQGARPAPRGPSRREWRTPPLWGLRDSAPYLHDGRAETLDQAILLHDGQARGAKGMYRTLPPAGRHAIDAFLKSLPAPSRVEAGPPKRQAPGDDVPRDGGPVFASRGG